MAVDEEGNSADEGSIDPSCPVFARLNLAFPEALWDDAHLQSGLSKILP